MSAEYHSVVVSLLFKEAHVVLHLIAPKTVCGSAKGNQVLWVALPVIEHNKDFRVGDLIHHAIIGVSWIIWILCWRREETLLALCILTNQDSTIIHVPQTTRVG